MSWPEFTAAWAIDLQRGADPYACWVAATQGAYLASHADGPCRVALRLRTGATIEQLRTAKVCIPAVYDGSMRHATAEVTGADPADWQDLFEHAEVALAEPGMARPDDEPRLLDPMRPPAKDAQPVPRSRRRVVVGVVDGACGFANRQFRSRGRDGRWQTRLAAFWDQQGHAEGDDDWPWSCPPELGYGRELGRGDLDVLLEQHLGAPADSDDAAQAAGERAIYDALGIALPAAADWTHGTHVLDTVGGAPHRGFLREQAAGDVELPEPNADVAAADLVVVQLPEVALRDTSGRWAAALVLDGLRYIVARADPRADIVINLSLGSFAGPHDGSSMLEQAIDALIEEQGERLTVVVAAGNARQPRNDGDGIKRHCHARTELSPQGTEHDRRTLVLDIDEADATETFVELWLPDASADGGPAAIEVDLVPPGSDLPVITTKPGTMQTWPAYTDGMALAQVVNLSGSGGVGGKGPMVLVAIGTTRDVKGYRAPVGRWLIRVHHQGAARIELLAWVERRDVPGELAGERPQYGFGLAPGVAWQETNTLGSLANGERTIVVGAAEFSAEGAVKRADSSSEGPEPSTGNVLQRQPPGAGPAVWAACEFAAAGFLTGSYKTLKGTSMSAAWVTRIIAAEILAYGRPEAGVRAWLLELTESSPATRGSARAADSDYIVLPKR